ncbi:MAG: YHS domain-containing (seleno)protein [Bacteroidota bacterium]
MKTLFLLFVLSSFWSFCALAQEAYIYSDATGAIKGYDPVSYFTESKPVKGKKNITYKWKDANWYFASKKNLDAFKTDPEAYAPQYGGYCAYAVSEGYTAKIEPEAWKIVDGKLYLNYDLDVKKIWEADEADRIKKAEANWPSVLDKD